MVGERPIGGFLGTEGKMIWLQEKDGQIRRLKAGLKAAEERCVMDRADAAASPLDAAQRSVIRNLGLKVSSLSQQVAGLKEERDLAQVKDALWLPEWLLRSTFTDVMILQFCYIR